MKKERSYIGPLSQPKTKTIGSKSLSALISSCKNKSKIRKILEKK
jgi:hypothetical protein